MSIRRADGIEGGAVAPSAREEPTKAAALVRVDEHLIKKIGGSGHRPLILCPEALAREESAATTAHWAWKMLESAATAWQPSHFARKDFWNHKGVV